MTIYLFAAIISYLIGSVPTAFLILKHKHGIDVRSAGSGNVGARNSYEVTGNIRIGIFVGIVDGLKGLVVFIITRFLFDGTFMVVAVATIAVLIGHNYSVWIGFRGGRGLATAAGALLFSFPMVLAAWVIIWIIVSKIKDDVIVGNMITSASVEVLLFVLPLNWWLLGAGTAIEEGAAFRIFVTVLLLLIFTAHLRKPLAAG
ncbi:MAG TPA: glycerol-3-phosphate acyltransferase [Candidatus Kapabacteria bacterium]|nr:glycerol-3-phosphate acyltransferase [Candidatus Kapabacteria bacterium]